MSEIAHQNHVEKKAFLVNSSSLKDVRNFCREVFEKLHIQEDLKDELVLAIAEAAQNIVKHAFKNAANANELMVVQISCENNKLQIAFYDRGTPVDPKKVKHREIDNVKPGGLGTFFIQEIMDAVEFKDGKKPWINHLVLTKQLKIFQPINAPTLKIGEYIAIISPPIITPINTIIMGSIKLDKLSTTVSNSDS